MNEIICFTYEELIKALDNADKKEVIYFVDDPILAISEDKIKIKELNDLIIKKRNEWKRILIGEKI